MINKFNLQRITEFNKDRGIFNNDISFQEETAILFEEFLELLGYKDLDSDKVKLVLAPLFYDGYLEMPTKDKIDALADIVVVAIGMIERRRYNSDIVMDETLKEIESRIGSFDDKSGKWQKDKNQDKSTLYKANYNLAIRN